MEPLITNNFIIINMIWDFVNLVIYYVLNLAVESTPIQMGFGNLHW